MRRLSFALLLATLLHAAGPAGKWGGFLKFMDDGSTETVVLELKVSGTRVTGTVGIRPFPRPGDPEPAKERQFPIVNGKFVEATLTFEMNDPASGQRSFTLQFNGERFRGTCAMTPVGGGKRIGRVDLER